MTHSEMRRRIERSADILSVDLYEGVTTGVGTAREMLRALPNNDDYPHLLSLNARAFMREHWRGNGLPEGWEVAGNPRLMGQTMLLNPRDDMEFRLLKERRRRYPGGVPVAGSNAARQSAWRQLPLRLEMPDGPVPEGRTRLLALWDLTRIRDELQVRLRVVHTLGPGVYGSRVPIDLSYEIRPSGGIFESLEFIGDPQDDDLFADIDREENEGGATSG